jgi:hypothetical protein
MKRAVQVFCVAALIYLALGGTLIGQAAPIKVDRLSVLIVSETANRGSLPSAQLTAMLSVKVTKYVESVGGQIRRLDPDADISKEEQWVKDAYHVLGQNPLPWVVVASARGGDSVPMPANLDEFMALIEKYGGAP